MVYPGERSVYTIEEYIFCCLKIRGSACIYISVKSSSYIILVKSSTYLVIFCQFLCPLLKVGIESSNKTFYFSIQVSV